MCVGVTCTLGIQTRFEILTATFGKDWGPVKGLWFCGATEVTDCLSTLSTDTAGQLDVLGHDGHTLGVDGAQVGVLKQTNKVGLAGLLTAGT